MLSTSSGVFADDSALGGDVAGLFGKQAQVYGTYVWAYVLLAAALAVLVNRPSKDENPSQNHSPLFSAFARRKEDDAAVQQV